MKKIESKVLKTNIIPAVVGINAKKKTQDPSLNLLSTVPAQREVGNFLERKGYSKF